MLEFLKNELQVCRVRVDALEEVLRDGVEQGTPGYNNIQNSLFHWEGRLFQTERCLAEATKGE